MLIDARGIVKSFGELTVLHGLDLAVERGEFLAIVGASGSGKSTLMNIIGLLDRATAGSYRLDGTDIARLSDDERAKLRSLAIGFVFQNFNLISRMDARRNVEMPMMYAGLSHTQRVRRADELLAMLGMANRAGHHPSQLSGGQKQRVAIARALANDPHLILADEPTGALDSGTGRMVMDIFHRLNKEQGRTIVLITHNPTLAKEADRTITLQDGRIVADRAGSARAVTTR